ncbi:hypothetical protein CL621_04480 [archaeon]|nr:hypothetical protein [archaeon]|tara:strand:- start:2195 stop:2932 length:738 start_codon:yes stop_codon:yes gene_type:complete
MKKIAIIPCYNVNIENLKKIVETTNKFVDYILIMDDGDESKINISGCTIIRNKERKGKGYSLKKGFQYALENGFDVIITLDGDGEHNPEDITKFYEQIKKSDFVVGQRKIYRSKIRKILNQWSSIWLNLLIPKIKDTNCGFRAIRSGLIRKMNLTSNEFEIEIEMMLEAVRNNAKIESVDIQTDINDKSNVKFLNYIKINNLFDKWVLRNKDCMNFSLLKKSFLVSSAAVGLGIGKLIELYLSKK